MNNISKITSLVFFIVIIGCTGEDSGKDENLPEITTTPVSAVTANSAKSGGEILAEGTSPINDKGICWSTNKNPTIDDFFKSESSNALQFESELSGLEPETQYYVRSYAVNSSGISYGNQLEFTTEKIEEAPCSPTENTLDHQGMMVSFSNVSAGEVHSFFGEYGVIGNSIRGDLRVDFNHIPETGVYTIVSDFSLNRTYKECIISATIDQGTLNSWCTSAPSAGDLVYVIKLDAHKYKITFCSVEFSCLVGYSDYHFTSDGNLTDQ